MSISNSKFVVVGDGAVGKTMMLTSYTSNCTPKDYQPTVFDNYNACVVHDGEPVSMGLWDTAGQEDYDQLRPLAYPQTDCFIVCYSVVSQISYQNIASKWVPELKKHCPDVPIVLVGTKLDLKNDADFRQQMVNRGLEFVSTEQGQQLAREIGATAFVECSAITQQNLKLVFDNALTAWTQYKEAKRRKDRAAAGCCTVM